MDEHIFVALIAALVNLVLSIVVPCALKGSDNFLPEVRLMLERNRAALLTSSVLTDVVVYLALKASPMIKSELPDSVLNLAQLSRR
jgi:hypothetical protein